MCLLLCLLCSPAVAQVNVDEAAIAGQGIRKLPGKRITLYTDLPANAQVDSLPEVFDQAFPQWCEYFGQDPNKLPDWRMTGFLMKDRQRFLDASVLPGYLPPFRNGYSVGTDLWLYDQSSDYYRRHLFLHEGTHGFTNTVLRGSGPPWYMEGIAEHLATHRWQDGRLTMGIMPRTREEVPGWARIKIVIDDFQALRAKSLKAVMEYGPKAHLEVNPYGWCWAAVAFLDGHPRYQERFRQCRQWVREADFNIRFRDAYAADWRELSEEWQVFVANLEYGYDLKRMAIDFRPGQPLPAGGAKARVTADRGWQSSGVRLEAGVSYEVRASGRYQVASTPQRWWCEPNGVSIRYYQGRPLGVLLGAVRSDSPSGGASPLIRPQTLGLRGKITPKETGTLYLRINDSAAALDDNAGELTVEVVGR